MTINQLIKQMKEHKHKSYKTHKSHKSHKSSKKHKHKNSSRDRSREKHPKHRQRSSSSSSSPSRSSIQSNYHSSSGSTEKRRRAPHYRFKVGEKIGHKYRIHKLLGDGTFGRVLEATYKDRVVAIKIVKPVDKYIESAKTERSIIKHINDRDSADSQGIVRYVESFYHRGHFCLVFKPLGKSLYDVIKMNNYKGFPIKMVQSFFRQILHSIGFLHRIGYTHTDLKPQNILLEKTGLFLKKIEGEKEPIYIPQNDKIRIIDFGGATKHDEHHSSIINTRQYRSPEVILECCRWNQISDVWSIGCIIVELFTGELLFETHNDYQHLYMIEKNSGYFPHWMVSKSPSSTLKKLFRDGKINQEMLDQQIDHWQNIVEMRGVREIFQGHDLLSDLLMKCLEIDPNNRINCHNALAHPYFQYHYP